jgi:putative ABC transport system substrate-binding protein
MKRREFITLLGGTAAAWPVMARAQDADRMRRIGVLINSAADDPLSPASVAALAQGLEKSGWSMGRNMQADYRWNAGDPNRARRNANELIALAPQVIVANGSPATAAVQAATTTIPIVFVGVIDPVGAGFVEGLARPGSNITGFLLYEYGIGSKWLELLRDMVPGIKRAAIIRDTAIAAGTGLLGAIQAVAPQVGVELYTIGVRDAGEIERGIGAFARGSNGGLIVPGSGLTFRHRDLIVKLAERYKLPTIYNRREYVSEGGLIAYGPDFIDQWRRAGDYIDRILKGEKAADLPVQAPTKYELVINLKAAKALGLIVQPTLLARADEEIE